MAPEGAKIGPRRAQEGPRWAQDGPKRAQDRPKRAQDGPKMGPRWPQDEPKMGLKPFLEDYPIESLEKREVRPNLAQVLGLFWGPLAALYWPIRRSYAIF